MRPLKESFVVGRPTGYSTRTRIRPTQTEAVVLRDIGGYLGSLYRGAVKSRIELGKVTAKEQGQWNTNLKRELTGLTSSRWAGAMVRSAISQYRLSVDGLYREVIDKNQAIRALESRVAVPVGGKVDSVRGYKTVNERFQKTRRLAILKDRVAELSRMIATGSPSVTLGGKRFWKSRNNLDQAGVTESQWRDRWDDRRMFLTALGETGATGGNQTIKVLPDGSVSIKVPKGLSDRYGDFLRLEAPISFDTHRGAQWEERVCNRQAVGYRIWHDTDKNRWYMDVSWSAPKTVTPPSVEELAFHNTLGVDLNAGFLTAWVIDPSGNPVGQPHTVEMKTQRLPASTRDARVREAITELLDVAKENACASITIEDLNFSDARASGRETMGRGKRGKQFRRTVASIPTSRFSSRLVAMAETANIWIVAVDPAYTSKWGGEHWLEPMRQQNRKTPNGEVCSRHHAAAIAIGRRSKGLRIRRKPVGLPLRQRTDRDLPIELASSEILETHLSSPYEKPLRARPSLVT